MAAPSRPEVAIFDPSGLNVTDQARLVCAGKWRTMRPEAISQNNASAARLATNLPSGLNATPVAI
jgi:hypothetical protein